MVCTKGLLAQSKRTLIRVFSFINISFAIVKHCQPIECGRKLYISLPELLLLHRQQALKTLFRSVVIALCIIQIAKIAKRSQDHLIVGRQQSFSNFEGALREWNRFVKLSLLE